MSELNIDFSFLKDSAQVHEDTLIKEIQDLKEKLHKSSGGLLQIETKTSYVDSGRYYDDAYEIFGYETDPTSTPPPFFLLDTVYVTSQKAPFRYPLFWVYYDTKKPNISIFGSQVATYPDFLEVCQTKEDLIKNIQKTLDSKETRNALHELLKRVART